MFVGRLSGMKGDFMNENISFARIYEKQLVIQTQKDLMARMLAKNNFDVMVSLLLLVPLSIVF